MLKKNPTLNTMHATAVQGRAPLRDCLLILHRCTRAPVLTVCSYCTGEPVHARSILLPGLARRPECCS